MGFDMGAEELAGRIASYKEALAAGEFPRASWPHWAAWLDTTEACLSQVLREEAATPQAQLCAKWPRGSGGRFSPARDGAAPTAARGCFCSVRTWATAFAIRTARRPARVRWKFGLCSAPGTPEGRRRFNETRPSTAASLPPAYGCRMAPGAGVPDQVPRPLRVSRNWIRRSHAGPEDEAGADLLGGGADGRGPLKWGKRGLFDPEIEQMNAKGGET